MDFNEFSIALRSGEGSFSVQEVQVVVGDQRFEGSGRISVKNGKMTLDVVLPSELPKTKATYDYDGMWLICGVIENHIPFWTKAVPHSSLVQTRRFKVRSSSFSIGQIHHLTAYFEEGKMGAAAELAAKEHDKSIVADSAHARLPGYKIVDCDMVTTITKKNPYLGESSEYPSNTVIGEFGKFEYALIQEGDNCSVHLDLKEEEIAAEGEIQKVFERLLLAVAFAHGQEAWPCYEKFSFKGNEVREWTRSGGEMPLATFPPLTRRACHFGAKVTGMVNAALATFSEDSSFCEDFKSLMFLAREAGSKQMPDRTGTLGLCAVFEGLVSLLANEHLTEKLDGGNKAVFLDAKKKVLKEIDELSGASADETEKSAFHRVKSIVSSANFIRPKDSFRDLLVHFGIIWDGDMEKVLTAWQRQRHARAHGVTREEGLNDIFDQSRIAGAINLLAAAEIGYKGEIPISMIEDKYLTLT